MHSLRGQLLIASPRLVDPNFAKSVILIVQHDEAGALGVVINRPLELTVQQVCREALETACSLEAAVYHGGPCPGPLMVVHTHAPAADLEVREKLYFTTERAKIERLLEGESPSSRFFVGYAGWGAGQLEAELESGSWLTAAAAPSQVFATNEKQWSRLMTELTVGRWIDPARIPEDPSVN
jgi:putative transcriptional regulator